MTIGRPRLSDDERRGEILALRITPSEKADFEKQAANAGMSTATFARNFYFENRNILSKDFNDAALLNQLNSLTLELKQLAAARPKGCDSQRLNALLVQLEETIIRVSRAYGA